MVLALNSSAQALLSTQLPFTWAQQTPDFASPWQPGAIHHFLGTQCQGGLWTAGREAQMKNVLEIILGALRTSEKPQELEM